ncbi:MAG: DUF4154 domain-containing protein [Salinivirgaceae bacterium]|nr:DUF4154 domain-containing protein [Salinivirgaceae bacterium]
MLLIFLKFIASAALLFVFYRIVLRGKASYAVSRAYLLALPIVSLIISVLTFEVYPTGTEFAIEQIDFGHYTAPTAPVETGYAPDIAPAQVTTAAPAAVPAAMPATAPVAEPVQVKQPIVIDWMAMLKWTVPAISLLLLLLAAYHIGKVLAIKSKMDVENTAEGYSLISSPSVNTPFSFAKTIFLPASLHEPGKSMIIRHEKAHIRHRHYADVWFMELITRLFWFNPFVWLCRNELRNVHEFQADHDVIESNVNINAYQTTLLEMVMNVSSPVVNGFNHSFIRQRFIEMKKSAVGTLGRVAKIGTLAWIGVMFCAFTFTEKRAEPNPAALSPDETYVTQKLLLECKSMVNYSHLLTKNWVYIDRNPDTPDKLALKKIHNEDFPKLQAELLEVSEKWNNSDREELESIFTFINDTLFAYQKNIMERLKTLTDYEDMFVAMDAQMMVEEGGDETNAANEVNARIDALIKEIRTAATTQTTTERTVFQTLGPGKFVIEGAVDPEITDSCYLIYFADEKFDIIETPVACVPVVDKKFHYEVELNDLTVCRIRCIFPGGEICSAWIETFAAPGVTFELTVHNGHYSGQYTNYVSKIRRLADTYCKNHHLNENAAKPDGLYKTWENVKYGNWNNQKVKHVDFCEKRTVVTLSAAHWERGDLNSDVCLRDSAGNLYKMLHNESSGNRYIDYIRGARYAFEPLPKGVAHFDLVQKVSKKVSFINANGANQSADVNGQDITVIVENIRENLTPNPKPNFSITFKTELTNEVTGFRLELMSADENTKNYCLSDDVELDSNGMATFNTYLDNPCMVWVLQTLNDGVPVYNYQISIPFVPGENAQFTLTSTGIKRDEGPGFRMEMPSYQLTGSKFYTEWEKAEKKFNEIFDKQGDKANAAINEYVKKNANNLGLVMQYLIGPWNADYSILPEKTLQNPMVKLLKQRDDEWKKSIAESQKRREEARTNTAPGKMFADLDLQNMSNPNNRPSLSDIVGKGRYVLVNFCYPPDEKSKETGKAIDALLEKFKGKPIDAISIVCNYISGPDYFKESLKGFDVSHKVYYDVSHQANRTYGFGNGEIILFGLDGTILKRDIASNELEKTVEEAMNGKLMPQASQNSGSLNSVEQSQNDSSLNPVEQNAKFLSMLIYNFTKHVEWPATKGDFVVCVLGKTEVLSQLKAITNGKTVNGKPIKVVGVNNVGDIPNCQILYVPTGEIFKLKPAIEKVGNAATLIVSNFPGALDDGSCINFVEVDEKIKYEASKANIENRGLKANLYLLNNAVNN